MRKILHFIGSGGAFSKKYVNNSAYYYFDYDKIVLFDVGETVFHEILKLNLFNSNIHRVDIVITHFHSDHVGSLGSLIFYLRFKKIEEVNIIFPIKALPYTLLSIFGINENLFRVKTPDEISDYYIKEYEQLHGDVGIHGEIIPIPSYGYHIICHNDNFFYSGDTCIINDIILEKFENKKIILLYQEVSTDGYQSHLQLAKLEELIPKKERKRVICMHMSDNIDIAEIKKLGFESVR